MSEDTVTITTEEYESMLEDVHWRCALECGGVDNWSGIEFALNEVAIFTENGEDKTFSDLYYAE